MPRPYPAALLLPGDAFDTTQLQVLGRRVAGRSFAQGLVGQLRVDEQLTLLVTTPGERDQLRALLEPHLPRGAVAYSPWFSPGGAACHRRLARA